MVLIGVPRSPETVRIGTSLSRARLGLAVRFGISVLGARFFVFTRRRYRAGGQIAVSIFDARPGGASAVVG